MVVLNERMLEGTNQAVTLSCEVRTRVAASTVITWLHRGRAIDATRERARFLVQTLKRDYGLESRLSIAHFTPELYGVYNCSAENEYGAASAQHHFFVQSFWEKLSASIHLWQTTH